MIHYSWLTASKLAVSQNAVKSILFRCAALLVQFTVVKLFALLASKQKAFTAYLVFTEDYLQQGLFVISQKFVRGGLIVFCFAILFAGAGFFDALLWGLDAPGYLAQKSNDLASSLKDKLLPDPGYIVFASGAPGQVASLEEHLADNMGTNLFKAGVNFTLTENFDHGTPRVVPPTQELAAAGPRIWLDKEGFSVSTDTYIAVGQPIDGNVSVSNGLLCPRMPLAANSVFWNCTFSNSYATSFTRDIILGRPEIHWDDFSDLQYQSQYLRFDRHDNPWTSLGAGGDTALMKQVFTVTKGRNRHTFLETALKINMITDYDRPFPFDQIFDLIKRSSSTDPAQQAASLPLSTAIAKRMVDARNHNASFMFGMNEGDGTSVAQANWELLSPQSRLEANSTSYTLVRLSAVNITLVRSDVLPEPVQPAGICDNKFFQNLAKGGRVYGTDCYRALGGNNTNHRFFGQLDTSSAFILNGVLGDGTVNSSAGSLNQNGLEWLAKNEPKIDNLILSRGMILGLDPALVTVETSKVTPALSYLQIILVVLVIIISAISWLALTMFATAHYSSTLLQNLLATTNTTGAINERDTSRKPGYVTSMPEIRLGKEGETLVLETVTGVYRHEGEMNATSQHHFANAQHETKGAQEPGKQETQVSVHMVAPTPSPLPTDSDPFFAELHAR